MIKMIFFFLLLCTFQLNIHAQDKEIDIKAASISDVNSASVDDLASYIKQNFTSETDRIRAIYIWITNMLIMMCPVCLPGKRTQVVLHKQ